MAPFLSCPVHSGLICSTNASAQKLSESTVWICEPALKQTPQRKKPEQNVLIKVQGWIIIIFSSYIAVFISKTLYKEQLNKPFNIPIKQINKHYQFSVLFGREKKSFFVYNYRQRLFQNNDSNFCVCKLIYQYYLFQFSFQGNELIGASICHCKSSVNVISLWCCKFKELLRDEFPGRFHYSMNVVKRTILKSVGEVNCPGLTQLAGPLLSINDASQTFN